MSIRNPYCLGSNAWRETLNPTLCPSSSNVQVLKKAKDDEDGLEFIGEKK